MTPTGRLFVASEICQEIIMLRTMPRTMQRMRMIMLSAIAALVMTAPTWAAECTIERDKLDDALRATPSCAAAYRLFELCEYGASGDVPLGAIVQEKCEADFLPRLDGARKGSYRKKLAVCNHKYAKEDGTMYRSFEAFCRAGAARDFSKRYSR
jgi:hypothetical protein